MLYWDGAAANKRRLRANVFPESAGIFEGTMMEPPQPERANIPGIIMVIKNSGQTPAYKIISWVQLAVIEPINEHTLLIPKFDEEKHAFTLGSGGTFSKAIWFDRALTAHEIEDIRSRARSIYLYGIIEYRDVSNRKMSTNFRLHYNGTFPPVKDAVFWHSEKGNYAT